MKIKAIYGFVATLALGLFGHAAYANVLSLTPLTTIVNDPGKVVLEVHMDFVQETVGGAFDLLYDSEILQFISFDYDPQFLMNIVDPDFLLLPDNCIADGSTLGGCEPGDAELNALGFGNFDGIIGSYLIGRVTFMTQQPGATVVELAATDSPFGGFISALDASTLSVVYNDAKVLVTPLPAAVWMMLGALGVLGRLRRA